jgi:alkanesulfonate monooxygenase SsuD/methylene tetrahydromethanopterin reductase-like flavin-dependent oxidoreductase (luciferase family)
VQRSIVFATPHLKPLPELARLAEASGFDRAWTTEFPGRDALVRCGVIAAATTTLRVGTGIAYGFTRHPLALAAAALDLQEATGGRFALGLGAGTKGMRWRWFGIRDEKPVARLRETVAVIRVLEASTGLVSFHGAFYDVEVDGVDSKARLAGLPPLPVYGSGFNAAMMAGAAAWTDGILLHPLAASEQGQQQVRAALAAADPADLWLSQWVITAISDDGGQARDTARRTLAFYLSTPSYGRRLEGSPWEQVPAVVAARFREIGPDWERLARDVPEEMVEDYCIAGTAAEGRDQVGRIEESLARSGVRELVLQVAVTGLDEPATTVALTAALRGLAPR